MKQWFEAEKELKGIHYFNDKGEYPAVKVKPFPTCETCPNWKTHFCIADNQWTRNDFFCAGHPDFNPDNGGNNGCFQRTSR